MGKALNKDTKLVITRQVKSITEGGNDRFTNTDGQALSDGDFNTSAGTIEVTFELHPDEWANYEGCHLNLFDGPLHKLELREAEYGPGSNPLGVVIENGKAVRYDADGSVINYA